jgi:hypothetical protein
VSDGADPTSPQLAGSPELERERPKLSSITLTEKERTRIVESIDRQIAEIDSRKNGV